ncbi:hypothetical protein Tco_0879861, partial [Tanacetum coccineum]
VIILDSDTSTESLERSSFYDIPLSTHLFKTSSDNAFDLSSKEDKLRSNYKTLEVDVGLPAVSLIDVVEAKNPPPVRNCILGLASVKTWQQIMQKEFGIKKGNGDVGATKDATRKGKSKMV